VALYGAVTWTLREFEHKYLGSFKGWCWRRMERIRWTDRVRNEEVLGLHRVSVERNILHAIKTRTGGWIGPILHRKFLLKHVFEGNIEGRIDVTGRRRRRSRKQVLYKLK
jgi:hypothetical protein